MSHGWFVLLMALAVIAWVGCVAVLVTTMARDMDGRSAFPMWSVAFAMIAAMGVFVLAFTGVLP